MLLENDDIDVVAQQTTDAGSFLLKLHREGKLRKDLAAIPISVAYHTPCHMKALHAGQPLVELLSLIPQLKLQSIDKGCTGMAGMFGLAAENFEQSLRIGAELMSELQRIDVMAGTTDCSSCRMQMEQTGSIPTIHPIKLLALAYGLMPGLGALLRSRPNGLTMS